MADILILSCTRNRNLVNETRESKIVMQKVRSVVKFITADSRLGSLSRFQFD